MPPVLPQDKSTIPIADVDPEQKAYYEKWIKTRSDTQGIPVGVHLNVSINDDVLKTVWQAVDDQYDSYADFVNYIYIKIAQGFDYYRWLITYLFGNSRICCLLIVIVRCLSVAFWCEINISNDYCWYF